MLQINKINIIEQIANDLIKNPNGDISEVYAFLASEHFLGLVCKCWIMDPGNIIYRARITSRSQCLKSEDISYHKDSTKVELGRANYKGQPIFYGSNAPDTAFHEVEGDQYIGSRLLISAWKTTDKIIVNDIGFFPEILNNLMSKRFYDIRCDANMDPLSKRILTAMGVIFTCTKNYELTNLIAQKFRGNLIGTNHFSMIEGLRYPSIAQYGNSDNFALAPDVVNKKLSLLSVREYEILSNNKIKTLAQAFPDEDYLRWEIGSKYSWTTSGQGTMIKIVKEAGVDNWGWADSASPTGLAHWACYDQLGNTLRPNMVAA